MGFGLTPLALAAASVATAAKVPEIVTAAATAMITEKVALYRSHLVHSAAGGRADRRVVAQERGSRSSPSSPIRPRHRREEMVRRHVREGRWVDPGKDRACR